MSRTVQSIIFACVISTLCSTASASGAMVVSPGEVDESTVVAGLCPTFSWSQAPGAKTYELAVFEIHDDESGSYELLASTRDPVISKTFPAPSLSWTPSAESCLVQGVSYIWYVRDMGQRGPGGWSEGGRFRVDMAMTMAALQEAIDISVQNQFSDERTLNMIVRNLRASYSSSGYPTATGTAERVPGARELAGDTLEKISLEAIDRAISPRTISMGGGKIGLGTDSPSQPLHITGMNGTPPTSPALLLEAPYAPSGNQAMGVLLSGITGDFALSRFVDGGDKLLRTDIFADASTGNVGIGTVTPGHKLDVIGNLFLHGTDGFNAAGESATLYFGHPAHSIRGEYGAGVKISAFGAPDSLIIKELSNRVVVKVLEITGGADLSEKFEVYSVADAPRPSPGMVVSIDPENPGALVVSSKRYDRTVAGIISGAGGIDPGMLMGPEGLDTERSNLVALTGRVYAYAETSQGEILPGDLLTTSATPGHAMKVTDYAKAQGAILGKAMSMVDEKTGMVLVLVTLQ